ncbi:MAG: hypothetical protein [aquatic viral metagenome]
MKNIPLQREEKPILQIGEVNNWLNKSKIGRNKTDQMIVSGRIGITIDIMKDIYSIDIINQLSMGESLIELQQDVSEAFSSMLSLAMAEERISQRLQPKAELTIKEINVQDEAVSNDGNIEQPSLASTVIITDENMIPKYVLRICTDFQKAYNTVGDIMLLNSESEIILYDITKAVELTASKAILELKKLAEKETIIKEERNNNELAMDVLELMAIVLYLLKNTKHDLLRKEGIEMWNTIREVMTYA